MRYIPRELLQRLFDLPAGVPSRIVLNTNGQGEWKTESTVFPGVCRPQEVVDLYLLLHAEIDNSSESA